MDKECRINELLESISNNENYRRCVFKASGIYFVIVNGKIREISDDAGCSPKGGWFPEIVTGPTKEENTCLEKIMKKFVIDEYFFSEYINDCGEFNDEYVLEYFEDGEDERSAKVYRKIKKEIDGGKTLFKNINDFVSALVTYGLEPGCLYYEWEGEYIDLYENICDTGEERGSYERIDDEKWIAILENIDDYMVRR